LFLEGDSRWAGTMTLRLAGMAQVVAGFEHGIDAISARTKIDNRTL
jgi:hypothetical protein